MFKTSAETNGFSWVLDKFISEKNKRMWSTPADNGWLAVSYATWNRVRIRNRELDRATLCILVDFLTHIDTICIGLPMETLLNHKVVLCLKFVLIIISNNVDPDETQHYAAFHHGLHCLPNYLCMDFPGYKVL